MWRAQSQQRDGGGGQQECKPQMVANYTTMRVPARTKELIAARDADRLSRETLWISPHIYHHPFVLSNEMGGSEIIGKKCPRGGVGIGNSAGRGMWAGKRYYSTPIMQKRLIRAAHSSHKSSSSPGLCHLLGNFLVLLIVSAAEWLWRLGENNGKAQRSEISGNTANNCTLNCSQTVHRNHHSFGSKLRHLGCNLP